jgi:endoglucanase
MPLHPASPFLRKGLLALASFFLLAATLPAATSVALPANPTFQHGISVGHWMAKMRSGQPYGGPWFGRDDVAWIAQQGFDHVRWPVDGRLWLLPDGSLDEAKIARFLEAVIWARDHGMSSVLDMHFLPGGGTYDANNQDLAIFTDEKARSKAAEFWGKVAQRLAGEGAWLRFELVNEPMAPRHDQLNALNLALLAAVRTADRQRVVYLTSNLSSSFATLADVTVPDDRNVAIVLHYDEPMIFTHQRASWKQLPANMPPVNFPGVVPDLTKLVPPDHFAAKVSLTELKIEDVDTAFAKAAKWLRANAPGKEVYLGEFGSYEMAPADSRRIFARTVRTAAERHGWGWAVWDYKSSFGVRRNDGSSTAVLDGLFDR